MFMTNVKSHWGVVLFGIYGIHTSVKIKIHIHYSKIYFIAVLFVYYKGSIVTSTKNYKNRN